VVRRGFIVLGLVALVCGVGQPAAFAHAGLQGSDPLAGAMLGASPSVVRLRFSEKPASSLSTITVTDASGATYETGHPEPAEGEANALAISVRPLPLGVYTVIWRIVSAVDGHATAGAYAFGVRVPPTAAAAAAAARTGTPSPSPIEMLGRWLLILGLGVLLGIAVAGAVGFGEAAGGGALGAGAWGVSVVGLVLLATAQRSNAAASLSDLIHTSVGHAIVWRAIGIAAIGAALLVARFAPRVARRFAMAAAAVAALAAMAVHVAAGHAAGGGARHWASIATQWAHFAAMGVWLGGLAALLFAVRGAASTTKAAAVRRFSSIAVVGLLVVVVTGFVRAYGELSSRSQLTSTGYGRAVVAKTVLIGGIAVFAGVNRWRSVPAAPSSLRPLRRTSSGELTLAATALAVAAVLGTLTPPAAARVFTQPGISVTGVDFATTVRARLTVASNGPGPNSFTLRVVDYDSNQAVEARRVSLRFTPLDDPGVAATDLALQTAGAGSYAGTGDNLIFDGRWQVTALIERDNASVTVPLTVDLPTAPQFVSVTRVPGEAPFYAVQIADETNVIFIIDPERPGANKITVTFADLISDERAIAAMVLTTDPESGPVRQEQVRRVSRGAFVAHTELSTGRTEITATARTPNGTRLRATFSLTIGGG
jgi:copper transport protein